MSAAEHARAVADGELPALFSDFSDCRRVILAVSGGPDSTALLSLAARWRARRKDGPALVAATVDHGLRRESRDEAAAVARLAKKLNVPHHTLVWRGPKPKAGLQEAARAARYALLLHLARELGAEAIATAHTLDDQAETVLHRMARGSGLGGLGGIRRRRERDGVALLRPLLELPKARLVATVQKLRLRAADDPSNRDPRFLRARLRSLMPGLEREGLNAEKLSLMARRLLRANEAIEHTAREDWKRIIAACSADEVRFDRRSYFALPAEVALRLLGRAIDTVGHEGPAELGKLETLCAALAAAEAAGRSLKRTLAGAVIECAARSVSVTKAPARRRPAAPRRRGR